MKLADLPRRLVLGPRESEEETLEARLIQQAFEKQEAKRLRSRRWRVNNAELGREASRQWRRQNREYNTQRCQKWREENVDKTREASREYYWENRDEVLKRVRARRMNGSA